MSNEIRILCDVSVAGSLSFATNLTDFPTNPAPRTIAVKDGMPYIFSELVNGSGFFTWIPMGIKHASYVHTQAVASTTWTVNHNFGTKNFAYLVYDDAHNLVIANINQLTDNTAQILLSSAMTGTVVMFSVEEMSAPMVTTSVLTVGSVQLTDVDGKLATNGVTLATTADLAAIGTGGGGTVSAETIAALTVNKVDKVAGKGLSTNDYTTAEKDLLSQTTTAVNGFVANLNNENAVRAAAVAKLTGDLLTEKADRIAADATTLTAANTYTNTSVANAVAAEAALRVANDATTLASAKTYADGKVAAGDAATLVSAKSYTDSEIAAVVAGGASAAAANAYTDSKVAAEATTRTTNDATTLASAKTYTDGKIDTEAAARASMDTYYFNSAKSHADDKSAAALASAKAYTNSEIAIVVAVSASAYTDSAVAAEAALRATNDAVTLSSANSYADGKDAINLASAKTYADGKVAASADATLVSANAYADGKVPTTVALAKAYTDSSVAAVIAGGAATASANTYTDSSVAAEAVIARAAEAALGIRISNVLSNTDAVALNSLSELVTAFQTADSNLTTSISSLTTNAASALTTEVANRTAADATTLASAKTYADSAVATSNTTTLASAKTYADGAITTAVAAVVAGDTTLAAAKTYADTRDQLILSQAHTYADQVLLNAVTVQTETVQALVDTKAPLAHVGATGTAHGVATSLVNGFMSSADKTKLDAVAAGATSNTGTVTGVTATSPLLSTGGVAPVISITPASTTVAGSMSAADKTKLDALGGATVTSVAGRAGAVVLTAADVGLTNASNTADADKPLSTAAISALALKAPLASPTLTGVPSAPTASAGTSTTQIATTAFALTAIAVEVSDRQAASAVETTARLAAVADAIVTAKAYTDLKAVAASGGGAAGTKNFSASGTLVNTIGVTPWIVASALSVSTVLGYLGTPSTSPVVISLNKNGNFLATLTIPANNSYVELPVTITAVRGDLITISITSAGTGAADLQLVFVYN